MRQLPPEYTNAQIKSGLYLIMDKIAKIGFEANDYKEAIENGYNKNRLQDLNHIETYKKDCCEYDLDKNEFEKALAEWVAKKEDPIEVLRCLKEEERQRFANNVSYLALACCYIQAKTNRRNFLLKYNLLPQKEIDRRALMSDEIPFKDEICTDCTLTLKCEYLYNKRNFKAIKIKTSQSVTLKSLWGTLLNGSLAKHTFIDEINKQFYDLYVSGRIKRLYNASSTIGGLESDRHDMSSKLFDGLKIEVRNDSGLSLNEIEQFAKDFLEDKTLVRQLLSLGYSTLIVKGDSVHIESKYRLKSFE